MLRAPRNSIHRQQIIELHGGGGEKGVFVVFIMNRDVQIHFLLPVLQDGIQGVGQGKDLMRMRVDSQSPNCQLHGDTRWCH